MFRKLYHKVLENKIISICILFTIFTTLDTLIILFGLYPPKDGWNVYIHLIGRLTLMTIVIYGIYLFNYLSNRLNSKIIAYLLNFGITWVLLFLYLKFIALFTELHPNAVIDMTRSYLFFYILFGILILVINRTRKKST